MATSGKRYSNRQLNADCGTRSRTGLDPELPPMHINDTADNRQPQPGAFAFAGAQNGAEKAAALLLADSLAGVLKLYLDVSYAAAPPRH